MYIYIYCTSIYTYRHPQWNLAAVSPGLDGAPCPRLLSPGRPAGSQYGARAAVSRAKGCPGRSRGRVLCRACVCVYINIINIYSTHTYIYIYIYICVFLRPRG